MTPKLFTDRAALYLQLVPYIVSRGEVPLAEAASDFGVSEETMRAMVEKLTVIGRPGDSTFRQMPDDLFDIDWDLLDERDIISLTHTVGLERAPRLTAREAAALLAGLQLTATLPTLADSEVVQTLLAKLARGASAVPADVTVVPGPVDVVRTTVAEALTAGVAVSFTYQAPDATPTTRTVDPVKVHIANGQWYLQGWCHLREGMRTFHLERVSDVALTDIPIAHGADPVPALFEGGEEQVVARLRYPHDIASLLGEYLARATVHSDAGMDTAELTVADEHSLKRLAARRGGELEILSPSGARAAAAAWAEAGLAQYR